MAKSATDRIREYNIEPESELGKALLKLDNVLQELEDTDKNINYLLEKKQQLTEDAEMMEMLLMHKFNTDARKLALSKNMRTNKK